jgi:bifunctional DNA-binding transcriptional regulator/antitoxin component of YhaV-PrlF toxin-antitoxin module
MKALGVVRNIDNLGRITIPMEIRRANGWDAFTPIEMFVSEQGLVLREYKPDYEKYEIIQQLSDVLNFTTNESVKKIVGQAIEFIKKN